jgi:hypothetical protein
VLIVTSAAAQPQGESGWAARNNRFVNDALGECESTCREQCRSHQSSRR